MEGQAGDTSFQRAHSRQQETSPPPQTWAAWSPSSCSELLSVTGLPHPGSLHNIRMSPSWTFQRREQAQDGDAAGRQG